MYRAHQAVMFLIPVYLINNGTGLIVNDTVAECNSCTFVGSDSLYGTPANTAVSVSGAVSVCALDGGSITLCVTGLDVGNNSLLNAAAVIFKLNTHDVVQTACISYDIDRMYLCYSNGIIRY